MADRRRFVQFPHPGGDGLWSSLVQQVRESGLVLGTGARAPALAVERMRRRAWALPDEYTFDRNEANER